MQDLKKTTELKSISNKYYGLTEYQKSLDIQIDANLNCKLTNQNTILGFEHPTVVTLGYRANIEQEVFDKSLSTCLVKRGGLATLHSPGQLVIYPIINLKNFNLGVKDYVYLVLNTTKNILQNYQIETFIDDQAIGLYTKNGKIAFCGIQVKQGVTLHGLSLNVFNDLSLFAKIRSCGVSEPRFTSVEIENSHKINLEVLFNQWVDKFYSSII